MRLNEFAIVSAAPIVEGIEHPEDSVFAGGRAAAQQALASITSLEKPDVPVSIKWDGFPALVFGRDAKGKLVLVDKHQYDKVVKGRAQFSTIKSYDEARGANRSNLWAQEKILRDALESVVPKTPNVYWMGDLMWTGKPKLEGDHYSFKPNTVEYQIARDSELGEKIANSTCGIAVHTYIPGLGASDTPLEGLRGLDTEGDVVFLTGKLTQRPKINVDPAAVKNAAKVIKTYGPIADKFINDLTQRKAKSVLAAASPFITDMLSQGDIKTNIVPRFLEFLGTKLSANAAEKLLGPNKDGWLYQDDGGGPGLLAVWTIWATLVDLKLQVKKQVDVRVQNSQVRAFIDGEEGHEGFVVGSGENKIKLVDRLGFTAANFAKHTVPQDEIAKKSRMPVAAFSFGRMNPPTRGHELVMKATVKAGGKNSFIFLSGTQNSDTDPLDFKTKAAFIKKIYPQYAPYIVMDSVTTPIEAANWLYERGFRNMVFVAGSDRLGKGFGSLERLLNSWNSGPVRSADYAHGPQGREYVVLNFVSSGERDSDTSNLSGISGTLARRAVRQNDRALFQRATGVDDSIKVNGKSLFQTLAQAMGTDQKKSPSKK